MADNPDRAFDIDDNGLVMSGDSGPVVWIGAGGLVPTASPYLAAPSGSRYYHTSGTQYEKFGPLDSDWREAAGVGSPTASPGFAFGKSGNNSGSLNQVGNVPSDITGMPNQLTNARAIQAVVDNQDQTSYSVEFFEHDGNLVNESVILTIVVSGSTGGVTNVDISLTTGKKIGARVSVGSQKNGIAVLYVKGDAIAT